MHSTAERIRTAYLAIHVVLDQPNLGTVAAIELSRAHDELAKCYYALTGVKIGRALGWA